VSETLRVRRRRRIMRGKHRPHPLLARCRRDAGRRRDPDAGRAAEVADRARHAGLRRRVAAAAGRRRGRGRADGAPTPGWRGQFLSRGVSVLVEEAGDADARRGGRPDRAGGAARRGPRRRSLGALQPGGGRRAAAREGGPGFVEVHRLSSFRERSLDISTSCST
jgi:hypothetical protein